MSLLLKIRIAYFNSQTPKTLLFSGKVINFLHRTETSAIVANWPRRYDVIPMRSDNE